MKEEIKLSDGVWFSIVAAEIMAVTITALFVLAKKNKYKYL